MKMKIVETSLNLRIERGKSKDDYILSKDIAQKQLAIADADIFTNIEFMACGMGYLKKFVEAGYTCYTSLDDMGRGILCEIKNEYLVTKVGQMSEPHLQHLRVEKADKYIDLITFRILVSAGSVADFKERNRQWNNVLRYIDTLTDRTHLILIGDSNHGVICTDINGYINKPRQYYNYQMVVEDLKARDIILHPIDGNSYRGYMKPDHIATGEKIKIERALYEDVFCNNTGIIGIPDHSCIVADIKCV